jgi:hypothetical protein
MLRFPGWRLSLLALAGESKEKQPLCQMNVSASPNLKVHEFPVEEPFFHLLINLPLGDHGWEIKTFAVFWQH